LNHLVIQYDPEAPQFLVLTHVVFGEPDPLRVKPEGKLRRDMR
jgi:hypothetical protein